MCKTQIRKCIYSHTVAFGEVAGSNPTKATGNMFKDVVAVRYFG